MTVKEAISKGYIPVEEKKAVGYISRRQTKEDYEAQEMQYAKNRKLWYALKPCDYSNNFCTRVYYKLKIKTDSVYGEFKKEN